MALLKPAAQGDRREPDRLEAFSDGVLAVIITIMALELRSPAGPGWKDLGRQAPHLLVYILSFTIIGIYWNNHHHLLRATNRINAAVMWANLLLLFWLSLIPVCTEWVADFYERHLPASVYGLVSVGAALAYFILVRAIISANGTDSLVAQAIGRDRKGLGSLLLAMAGAGLAWVSPWIAYGCYVAVALIWFVPDRRLEAPA